MKTYEATVTRDGKWWIVEVPELDGLTQARRLAEVELMARELIAVTLDIPLSEAHVNVTMPDVAGVNLSERVQELTTERVELEALERVVRERQTSLAKDLANRQVPVRDIGTALGVSFQRAQQLVSS